MPPGVSAETAAMAHVNARNMDAVIVSKSVGGWSAETVRLWRASGLCLRAAQAAPGQRELNEQLQSSFVASSVLKGAEGHLINYLLDVR